MTVYELIDDLVRRYMRIGVYWQLFSYFATMVFSVIIVSIGKRKKLTKTKSVICILLFLYLITVYIYAVVTRRHRTGLLINLQPFFSLRLALKGNKTRLMLVVENLIMLMPIGICLPLINKERYNAVRTIALGFLFSLIIEISQYVKSVGLFELDDLINNTAGVIIGYGCVVLCYKIFKRKI